MQLCERWGYDADWVRRQLRLMGLTREDHARAARLHALVVAPHHGALALRFHDELRRDGRFQGAAHARAPPARLRRIERATIGSLGRDFDVLGYYELRLRAGILHWRAGVPLERYLGAHHALARWIVERIPVNAPDAVALRELVHQLVMLDATVAGVAYYQAAVADLHQRLASSRTEASRHRERARRDSLTSVYNRDHVDHVVAGALARAWRTDAPLAIAMIDFDRFKPVNDRYGHAFGDVVLREVVARMRNAIREASDTLGRYGGDEFVLVLETRPRWSPARWWIGCASV